MLPIAYTPKTYDEKKQFSERHFAENRGVPTSETTPAELAAKHVQFAEDLGGTIVHVPVINDVFGLFGWCSDGVLEKVKHHGGSIVFGWTIWEWPKLMLTAEFHAVWQNQGGDLFDITPKPHGETRIAFVPDRTYPPNFDFDKRPRNRRCRLYQAADLGPLMEERLAQMKPAQLAYEQRRASKAGKSLSEWLIAKQPVDPLPNIIDDLIAAVTRREELMDAIPGFGYITPTEELMGVTLECDRLIAAMRAATPR